jgi:hypothetical protein
VHEHPVERLLDDETRHTHLDPFRNLADDRTVHIRIVRYEAQCRGTEADGRAEKETVKRGGGTSDFHYQVIEHALSVQWR